MSSLILCSDGSKVTPEQCHATVVYMRIVLYSSLILITGYIAVLVRIYRGTRNRWLVMILAMLLVSNVSAILADWTSVVWTIDSRKLWPYLYLECVFCYLRDALFNLAHWVFCFKYWCIAVEMQFLLTGRSKSRCRHIAIQACNVVFITLDLLLPVSYEISFIKIWGHYDSSSGLSPG